MTWWVIGALVVGVLVALALVRGPLVRRGLEVARQRTSRLAARDRERAAELGNPVPPRPPHERDGWS